MQPDLNHIKAVLNADIFALVKKWLAAFGLLVLLFQTAYPGLFTAWFYANRASIANKYCVNKKRPMLHCEGKCYLAKKIQSAETKRSGNEMPAIANLWVDGQPCLPVTAIELAKPVSLLNKRAEPFYHAHYAEGYLDATFRPPAA